MVGRIYKTRYYPNGNFLTAKLGSNPSFIWRSVHETQELIKVGASVMIGSGNSVDIFGDPRLPTYSNAYVTITHPELTNSKVQSLMQIGRREWDVEVVQDIFNVRDCNIILAIPLSDVVDMDRW